MVSSDLQTRARLLRNAPGFNQLGEDACQLLANLATPRCFPKTTFIFHEGDPSDYFYIVLEGRVKLFRESCSGKIIIMAVAHQGDTLQSVGLFTNEPHWLSAQAIDDVTLLCTRKEEFLHFVNKYSSVLIGIINVLAEECQSAHIRLTGVITNPVEQRVVDVLQSLAHKYGNILLLTCEEIAEIAGTTRETTAKVVTKLKKAGIISTRRGRITILRNLDHYLITHDPYLI